MFMFSETDDLVHVLGCTKASSLMLATFSLVMLACGFHMWLQAFSSPICVQVRVYISRKFSPILDCSRFRAVLFQRLEVAKYKYSITAPQKLFRCLYFT